MTSNFAAVSRPSQQRQSLEPLRTSRVQESSPDEFSPSSKLEYSQNNVHTLEFGDDRPLKRRRLDMSSPATESSQDHQPEPKVIHLTPSTKLLRNWRLLQKFQKNDQSGQDLTEDEIDFLPLPSATSTSQKSSKPGVENHPTKRTRTDRTVPNTPDALDAPDYAPRLSHMKIAGYFPWTGHHPEDILSEQHVKQGFFDVAPKPIEKELNTARVPLYNAFKHRSGVDNLATLFSLILDQKDKSDLFSSATSFKPPPRVTLTEAKRKSWIADLANSDVPLRKLSRTIPQGIRGQALLDQCLLSSVPISRSVWFAKCVGANEIRTLKRKGTNPVVAAGAESKWLREWTINVEQFLDAVLLGFGESGWKARVQYALRLATRLYLENLLDRDHYLDWTLKSFATAPIEQTPFWLLIINIYKKDIIRTRRRGKYLAETLIEKLKRLPQVERGSRHPLEKALQNFIRQLVLSKSGCFLLPDKWPQYVTIIRSCLDGEDMMERKLLGHLDRINERSMGINKREYMSQPSTADSVFSILDSVRAPFNMALLYERIFDVSPDVFTLISACLQWCISPFRCRTARVYLVSRLMKRLHRAGHDIDSALLDCLSKCQAGLISFDPEVLKRLAAELSRNQTFSVSKYMQWLTVRGLPKKGSFLRSESGTTPGIMEQHNDVAPQVCADPTQLLTDISLFKSDEHVSNLRSSLLDRAGFDAEAEQTLAEKCKSYLDRELSRTCMRRLSTDVSDERSKTHPPFSNLGWTIRHELTRWLRDRTMALSRPQMNKALSIRQLDSIHSVTLNQFHFIRSVLEELEDIAVLADVVGIVTSTEQEDILTSAVETIHRHAEAFSAIGALESLHSRVCQIYMALRNLKSTMPLFTTALLNLCTYFPSKVVTVKLLQQDLVRGDRGRAVAACSPFSDGIAESLQQSTTFMEDFEPILQSEPNMSEQTMSRLFLVLTGRIEKQPTLAGGKHAMPSFCQLLARLRLSRKSQGDLLMKSWMTKMLSSAPHIFDSSLLTDLIATSCLSFGIYMEVLLNLKPGSPARNTAIRSLEPWLKPTTPINQTVFQYPTCTLWSDYLQQNPWTALLLLNESGHDSALLQNNRQLTTSLALEGFEMPSPMSDGAVQLLARALDKILHLEDHSTVQAFKTLVESITPLSYPFVQLRLRLLTTGNTENAESTNPRSIIIEALGDLLIQPASSPNPGLLFYCSRLLQAMGPDAAVGVRHRIEDEFFEAFPRLIGGKLGTPVVASDTELQHLGLTIDRAFCVSLPNVSSSAKFGPQIIEKLSQYIRSLGSVGPASIGNTSAPASSPTSTSAQQTPGNLTQAVAASPDNPQPTHSRPTIDLLRYMLQLLCLQRTDSVSASSPTVLSKQTQQEQVKVLGLLTSIATHPVFASPSTYFSTNEDIQRAKEVNDFTFDVIATLMDDVTDEVRTTCSRSLRERMKDMRVQWIFGSMNAIGSAQSEDIGHGLIMIKDGKGLGEWKPKIWEILESGSGKENETCLGLGLFGARKA